jgi:molybdate transport system substrate-binding protein
MKKTIALALALCMLFALTACEDEKPAAETTPPSEAPSAAPAPTAEPARESMELVVFAAASMTETLTEALRSIKMWRPT